MSAESLLPWTGASVDYRDIVMVAGIDPYAYKGTIDEARPGVRPSGEGGCESWKKKPAADEPSMGGGMSAPQMGGPRMG